MQFYRVGGVVRDQLLGRASQDTDWVVVGATPQQLLDLGYVSVGKDFPVFLHPETKEEYALARTERKTARGYHGFAFNTDPSVTLEADLQRRDLTINAMAQDTDGTLIDPYNGQADLDAKILRHVSPAFAEDPVRILRLARFAARFNFSVAAETLQLMREMTASGEVDALVAERVWQELAKALVEPYPQRFIEVLRDCGALAKIFPEIDRLFGVPQPAKWHPEVDTGLHTLLALVQARKLSDDPQVIFAVLMHDLGKGTTPKSDLPSHPEHEERGAVLVQNLCERYRIPTAFRTIATLVARYHTHCHRGFELRAQTILKTLNALDAFRRPQRLRIFLLACTADIRGRTGLEQHPYPQATYFQAAFEAAQQVDVKAIVAAGYQGQQIAEQRYQRQIAAIKQVDKAAFQACNATSR